MLVSGSTEDMELVDLTTRQSCILPFPLKWAQGGLISETKAHLCNFESALKCVLLNLSTLKTTFSDATVSKVARTNSVMLNGQIASTGGRIDNSHSQITDQVQMVSLTESSINDQGLPGGKVESHCILHINSTTLISIGGYNGYSTYKTWFMHINANGNSWTSVSGKHCLKITSKSLIKSHSQDRI